MAPHKTHLAGPLSYEAFRNVDSLQLHAPFDSEEGKRVWKRSANHQESRREESLAKKLRQGLNVLVGVAVGIAAVLIRYGCEVLGSWRRGFLLSLLDGRGDFDWSFVESLAVAIVLTSGLAVLATCCVALSPPSAGSGIPGVLAYLNGVDVEASLKGKVMLAKAVGTVISVGGGLAVGPEGPMVHVGASVGMFVVRRCLAPALKRMGPTCRQLNKELERQPMRYYVQAAVMGAGAGIAAAFNAPLAGTVFVVEEAASFFSKRLLLHTFITCACAVATTNAIASQLGLPPESVYTRTGGCLGDVTWSFYLSIQVAVVGVLCGLLATLFNRCVVTLSSVYAKQNARLGFGCRLLMRRFAVSAIVGGFCGAFAMCLPHSQPCQESSLQNAFIGSSGCVREDWLQQLVDGSQSVDANRMPTQARGEGPRTTAYVPHPGLFGAQYNPALCPYALKINDACRLQGIEAHLPERSPEALHYCCGFSNLSALEVGEFFNHLKPKAPLRMGDEWPQAHCPGASWDGDNKVMIDHYSPGAALTLVSPTVVVRNLLTRGSPGILSWTSVAAFLVCYFALAVGSATAWVPGGLLVPMMAIGAAVGRLCGIAVHAMLGGSSTSFQYAIPWIPELKPLFDLLYPGSAMGEIDWQANPGILALAGCAAFLSGSGSIVMFVIVLLLEVTLEPFLIPVILISVLAARTVTSLLGAHGLYHELMNVQSLPFLPEAGHWRLGHFTVKDLLREDAQRARNLSRMEAEMNVDMELNVDFDIAPPGARESVEGDDRDLPPLLTLSRNATPAEITDLLERKLPGDSKPMVHGFPVVKEGGELCGLVTKKKLLELLCESSSSQEEIRSSVASSGTRSGNGRRTGSDLFLPLTSPRAPRPGTGVERVMDAAPFVLQENMPVLHAHMLFARCGLRHVVVVDDSHKPVGVLTRKSLMPWRTPWSYPNANPHHDTFLEQRNAHSPAASPQVSPRNSPPVTPPPGSRSVSRRGSRDMSRDRIRGPLQEPSDQSDPVEETSMRLTGMASAASLGALVQESPA